MLYAQLWDKHVGPRIGHLAVRDVRHPVVVGLLAELKAAGVGAQAPRRAMALGQQVLAFALASDYIDANPFVGVRKPSAKRARAVVPMTPRQVEVIRAWFVERGKERDAVLVSLMAYAGLRPGEAYGLTWDRVRERTLLIDCSAQDGVMKSTKTGSHRSVTMLAPLATDLAEWRMRCGRPHSGLVVPGHDGETVRRTESQNWAKRPFRDAAKTAGFAMARPYDLRHSFCSLLIHEGRLSIAEIAAQMGHSMTMTLAVYGHVFAETDGGARVSAEEAIRLARAGDVSVLCPPEAERPLAEEASRRENP